MGINHSSRVEVFVHVVWSTWDRAPFLTPDVREQVYRCIRRECSTLKAEIIALGGIEDHVHVLLRLPATITIAELVKQMKGSSSHLANHRILPRGFKWQGGYSAFSVSRRALPIVREYVLRQEEHHRDGTTFPGAEPERTVREGGLRAFPAANSFTSGNWPRRRDARSRDPISLA